MDKARLTRGIIKMEDIEAARQGLQDPREYNKFMKGLVDQEPGLAMGLIFFSVEESEKFVDDVPLEILEKIEKNLRLAMEVGYLAHKKAHDRFWEGIDLNSKI